MRVEIGLHPRSSRAESVERFGMTQMQEVATDPLNIARRNIIHAGVAEQVLQHFAWWRIAHRALHYDGEFTLVFELLCLRRIAHRLSGPDERCRGFEKEHWDSRDRQANFLQVSMIVCSARNDLGRLAWRQQLRDRERAHVASSHNPAIWMIGEFANDLAFDNSVFCGIRGRVPVTSDTHLLSPRSLITCSAHLDSQRLPARLRETARRSQCFG